MAQTMAHLYSIEEQTSAETSSAEQSGANNGSLVKRLSSLVKIEHTVFSLPFVLLGALLGADGIPPLKTLLLILLALTSARTAAMSFNRIIDRRLDKENPRTRERELPSGKLQLSQVIGLTIVSSALFIACAFLLNPLSGALSFPTLALILGYSYVKRFTFLSHLVLGLALGISPGAAWLAVGAEVTLTPVLLGLIILFWVAGFDTLYSLADTDFDRSHSLFSLPQTFGVSQAISFSRALHLFCFLLMLFLFFSLNFPLWSYLTLAPTVALFIRQHMLVKADDLSRLDVAFFTMNGWIGFLFSGAVGIVYFMK